jgi:hypothetical protein
MTNEEPAYVILLYIGSTRYVTPISERAAEERIKLISELMGSEAADARSPEELLAETIASDMLEGTGFMPCMKDGFTPTYVAVAHVHDYRVRAFVHLSGSERKEAIDAMHHCRF